MSIISLLSSAQDVVYSLLVLLVVIICMADAVHGVADIVTSIVKGKRCQQGKVLKLCPKGLHL